MSKPKKCKVCPTRFTPRNSLQVVCSPHCALVWARNQQAKRDDVKRKDRAKKLREDKERIKSKGQLLKEAQTEFNRYIRERDKDKPCISCNRTGNPQWHAGHYRSVGSTPELRFHEDNCHKQCAQCNNFESGNLIDYRIGLIERIGIERVEWLERKDHKPKHYTHDDIRQIKAKYKLKIKQLKQGVGA